METIFFYSMTKTELALLYFPTLKPENARRKLNTWIAYSSKLTQDLISSGYRAKQSLLTPMQVKLIVDHLGEP